MRRSGGAPLTLAQAQALVAAGQKLAAAPELESALQDLATFLKAAPSDVDALVYQAQALCLRAGFGGR